MDHTAVVSRIVDEIKNDGVKDFNLDDPFQDPSLVTNAFLDIMFQDKYGNTALMLAAAENRVLHVKGMLIMAINNGKLWQVLEMRNKEGFNCVDMAMKAGSETCAVLITKVAKKYANIRPKPNEGAQEDDVTVTMDMNAKGENAEDLAIREIMRQSSANSLILEPPKRITREKFSNLRQNSKGHDYLEMVKRSRSAHARFMPQRTFSVESVGDSSDGTPAETPQLVSPPTDHGVLSTMGERIRSIFGKKPPVHSSSFPIAAPSERLPTPTNRAISVTDKNSPYHETEKSEEDDTNRVRLPQQTSEEEQPNSGGMFRNAPWAHSKTAPPQKNGQPIQANGRKLPPLSLRRRASSDPRNRTFNSICDD